MKLWGAALIAALAATGVRLLTLDIPPLTQALLVVPVFGLVYLGLTWWLSVPEAAVIADRVRRRPPASP